MSEEQVKKIEVITEFIMDGEVLGKIHTKQLANDEDAEHLLNAFRELEQDSAENNEW
jgi:hypothetical protein